jgi:hypothetical protein
MSVQLIGGTSAVVADVDTNKNLQVVDGLPAHPVAGGYYTVGGGPAGIVAATLATDTPLFAMRLAAGSTRSAYISKCRIMVCGATIGVSAGVPGVLGIQRISGGVGSTGTERVSNKQNEALATATDMTSIQDKASALTMTDVVYGTEVAWFRIPLFINGAMWCEFIFEPTYPLVLAAGGGVCLRTRVVCPATQTWVFSYTWQWSEK